MFEEADGRNTMWHKFWLKRKPMYKMDDGCADTREKMQGIVKENVLNVAAIGSAVEDLMYDTSSYIYKLGTERLFKTGKADDIAQGINIGAEHCCKHVDLNHRETLAWGTDEGRPELLVRNN